MSSIIGIVLIVLAIIAFFKVTAFAIRVGLGIVVFIGLLLIVLPLLMVSG